MENEQSKQAIIGIILIIVLTFLMPYWMRWITGEDPMAPPPLTADSTRTAAADTTPAPAASAPAVTTPKMSALLPADEPQTPRQAAGVIQDSTEKVIFIENELVRAAFSNYGGRLLHWELKKYKSHRGGYVDLITQGIDADQFGQNGLDVNLVDRDGNLIDLREHRLFTDLEDRTRIELNQENPSTTIAFSLPVKGGKIIKEYTFHHKRYSMEVAVKFEKLQNYMGNRWYSFAWKNGLLATEENAREDYDYARAYVSLGGELETLDLSEDDAEKIEKSGQIDWTAIRTKYFLAAIIPHTVEDLSVTLGGGTLKENDHLVKVFNAALGIEFPINPPETHVDTFTVYLGPLSIGDLAPYNVGLDHLVMSRDWYENLFRPISRWIVLPAFIFLHKFIPNYGLVIIVFSILIKLLLHPLTKKSYESMSKMQVIQPKMTELREKYKNDPQRLNAEMMKFYKEEGINPLGGCLPMLLQMPLLFALFIVFRSTIQLRGEPFILWIEDLSKPDALLLPFEIPFLGDSIHVLPFLMGLTMIWQSKMTVTDPKQKMMQYFMPVFLIFIFYSLPSGLNLYYAIFNLLSMVQTRMIKKKTTEKPGEKDGKPSAKDSRGKADKKAPKSIKEALAQRRKNVAQGNRAQRRQARKK